MTTEVIVAICLGFFIGMILGRILWYKDGKRIKLQERIIDYYKDMVGYLKENLSKEYRRNHDVMMNNIDNIFQKIENSLLPETPETCPKCGAKYSGGATAPGDHVKHHNVNPPPTTPRPKIKPLGQRPQKGIGNVIDALNMAFGNDPVAINKLFSHRQICNVALADHRSVQVQQHLIGRAVPKSTHLADGHDGQFSVGVIGFINMVLEELGYPKVCSLHDEKGKITGFDRFKFGAVAIMNKGKKTLLNSIQQV